MRDDGSEETNSNLGDSALSARVHEAEFPFDHKQTVFGGLLLSGRASFLSLGYRIGKSCGKAQCFQLPLFFEGIELRGPRDQGATFCARGG